MIMPWECSECLKKGFSIGIEKIKKKVKQEAKAEMLKMIDKFDFRRYSLAVNPIQEGKNIRQLKEELKSQLAGDKLK